MGSTFIYHIVAMPALAGRRQSEYVVPAAIRGLVQAIYLYYIYIYMIRQLIHLKGHPTFEMTVERLVSLANINLMLSFQTLQYFDMFTCFIHADGDDERACPWTDKVLRDSIYGHSAKAKSQEAFVT